MAIEHQTLPGNVVDFLAPPKAPVLIDRSFLVGEGWLPPEEYLTLPGEPLETPTDERGLVDIPKLLTLVQSMVDPAYVWPRKESTHHFYWYANLYPHVISKQACNPAVFRELPIHKGELPRLFENLLHEVTLPPKPPSLEVMAYRIESWQVARSLFESARSVVIWQRREQSRAGLPEDNILRPDDDIYAQEWMTETIGRHFRGVERHMANLARVPPEFRLVEPYDSPTELASALGRVVVPRSLNIAQAMRSDRQLRLAA